MCVYICLYKYTTEIDVLKQILYLLGVNKYYGYGIVMVVRMRPIR